MQRNIFNNISPLDHRYSLRETEYNKLQEYFSERARIKYQLKVEVALVKVLARRGICSLKVAEEIETAVDDITVDQVYKEEKKTRHDIRALVNCIQKRVSKEAKPYVHFTTTSFDIIDTANSLRYKNGVQELLIPVLKDLLKKLMEIALREKDTVQVGRTHGQQAVPITFGFTIAEYVDRLGNRIQAIEDFSNLLKGKIAGAVGAYNASSLFFERPEEFEEEVLAELGLSAALHSTQIVEPEYMTDFIHSVISCFGVLANFSDDMRNLQRTEIGEIGEAFAEGQVGSSTMPHKRNPINFENIKSMWKEFMPRINTVYLDQISEHQRDLTNSASARFIPEIITGLYLSSNRLLRTVRKLVVDEDNLQKNLNMNREMIVAEPLYILLAANGHPDAHEMVRKLTLKIENGEKSLRELIEEDKELSSYWKLFTDRQKELLLEPDNYTGRAVEKTETVVEFWQNEMN